MSKTMTLRIEDDVYELIKVAADGQRRNISNFIEYATLQYLTSQIYVSDEEMREILTNKELIESLKSGLSDIENGGYTVV